jgi:hypothetical protein
MRAIEGEIMSQPVLRRSQDPVFLCLSDRRAMRAESVA